MCALCVCVYNCSWCPYWIGNVPTQSRNKCIAIERERERKKESRLMEFPKENHNWFFEFNKIENDDGQDGAKQKENQNQNNKRANTKRKKRHNVKRYKCSLYAFLQILTWSMTQLKNICADSGCWFMSLSTVVERTKSKKKVKITANSRI